jgi:hypothetical protein
MALVGALEDAEIAFRQLEFAIRLLSYCELHPVNPDQFDTDHTVLLENGNLHFPPGHFSDPHNILRAAGIGVLLSMSASAIALNECFVAIGMESNAEANDNIIRLRTLIYMVRCTHAHNIAAPTWLVKLRYQRDMTVDLSGTPLTMALCALNGQPFHIDQIGGYENWYRIRSTALTYLQSRL